MSKNHLADQTSPYLLQHVDNPVEWYPWCDVALTRAERENKPILLSIGYSACHWCHVMAHESFEDEATATIMNELFINIKIDREERPDIDKIYQTAQLLLTQRTGGWPLTMFLTPKDRIPFFGGTYFPNVPRHGLPAFKDLLQNISRFYHEGYEKIVIQNQSMHAALQQIYTPEREEIKLSSNILDICNQQLEQSFDARHGGFGRAPKFPHPGNIERLLRYYIQSKLNDDEKLRPLHIAIFTLEKMAAGGIYDHLGGGFSRYSTDARWMIPHFEKMLYDNGPLLALYAQSFALTGAGQFREVCKDTANWVMREMQSPEGGYYSTLDADSENQEGKFYAWEKEQIEQALDKQEYAVFAPHFGIDQPPNFEGKYHLHTFKDKEELHGQLDKDITALNTLLNRARQKLFVLRERRIRPGRDEKILVSWNALMIRGMVIAGRILNTDKYAHSARQSLDFIHQTMWKNQRLFATFKDGKAHLNAYLDDYAFLLDAILETLQTRWHTQYLNWAIELAEALLNNFEDPISGGFYFTSNDHERLIQRPKTTSDDATPSGNGIAAFALARLGYLLGETRYLDAAERALQFAVATIQQSPIGHTSLLHAYEEQLQPPQIIILRGRGNQLTRWQRACTSNYAPRRLVFAIDDAEKNLPNALAEKKFSASYHEGVVAYVCRGIQCEAPIEHLEKLQDALAETGIQGTGH